VQHLTLPEAYDGEPTPTFDGVSMFWYDELRAEFAEAIDEDMAVRIRAVLGTPANITHAPETRESSLVRAVLKDDMQLFDRSIDFPMHHKRAFLAAEERVIVDGPAEPEMVKAILIVSKRSGLTLMEFFERWEAVVGPLVASMPGVRRYVQNHGIPAGYGSGAHTHDGWSEIWFDDLAALRAARSSSEWAAMREEAEFLFAPGMGIGIARERIQKDLDWRYHDWGAGEMAPEEIRGRLREQGYDELAADPAIADTLKRAAADEALAVWTDEHLVTIDDSHIDARPGV
jgi:uncharacterized protein (TIGR02118 family)